MKYFVAVLIGVGSWLAEAWAFMVAVGIIHGSWIPALPALSYGASLQVNLGLSLFLFVWLAFKAMGEAVTES